jgi:hypothetical protein
MVSKDFVMLYTKVYTGVNKIFGARGRIHHARAVVSVELHQWTGIGPDGAGKVVGA